MPDVTPSGKPVKLGVVVATPAVPVNGDVVQQCRCDAMLPVVSPEKLMSSVIVFAVVSNTTEPLPIPGEVFGGLSAGPLSATVYVMVAEIAGDVNNIAAKRPAESVFISDPRCFKKSEQGDYIFVRCECYCYLGLADTRGPVPCIETSKGPERSPLQALLARSAQGLHVVNSMNNRGHKRDYE